MKLRKVTENQKSRRSLECLGADELERVTGGGEIWGHQRKLTGPELSTSQMFDML